MTKSDHDYGHQKNIILNARSLSALNWIGEQEAASRDHISQYLGARSIKDTKEPGVLSAGAADQIIKNWLDLGLVTRKRFITMTPPWIWLTAHGMRELSLDFRATSPRLGALPHLHAANFVRLLIEKQAIGSQWISQRILQAEQPKRTAGLSIPHLPDAVVMYKDTRNAIEVELTVKSDHRLMSILQELLHSFNFIYYYASREAAQAVREALLGFSENEQKQVRIALLEECGYSIITG